MIPIRCFTCGKVIANKWEQYQTYIMELLVPPAKALDLCGMNRYCCRRMFLTHVPIVDKILSYPQPTSKKS